MVLVLFPPTLPETNSSHLKTLWLEYDSFPFGPGLFSGASLLLVSGRVVLFPPKTRKKNLVGWVI